MASLYKDLIRAGIPIDHHESDLYVLDSPAAREAVNKYGYKFQAFTSDMDGRRWLDVPFAYEPFWEKKDHHATMRAHHSTRTPEKSYRVSALVGGGRSIPVNLATVPKKAAAMKIARSFMRETPPESEYDSVQILPLVRGARDWSTESIRWLGVTTNVRRPTWVRGQGIK